MVEKTAEEIQAEQGAAAQVAADKELAIEAALVKERNAAAERAAEAAKVAADKERAAEAARVKERIAAKERADNPHLHDVNYSGPLTGDQAVARLAKFGPLAGRETKPAAAPSTKSGK